MDVFKWNIDGVAVVVVLLLLKESFKHMSKFIEHRAIRLWKYIGMVCGFYGFKMDSLIDASFNFDILEVPNLERTRTNHLFLFPFFGTFQIYIFRSDAFISDKIFILKHFEKKHTKTNSEFQILKKTLFRCLFDMTCTF